MSDTDDMPLPDPLAEDFDRLEQYVARRQMAEARARCRHQRTLDVRTIGAPDEWICEDCGARLTVRP